MSAFHYLARAIIRSGDFVLLARVVGASNTFLPGGHIDQGEPAKTALKREVFEEIGVAIHVGAFVGAVEATWYKGSTLHSEINLLFSASVLGLSPDSPIHSREEHLEFLWVHRSEVDAFNLLPEPTRAIVKNPSFVPSAFWGSTME